nr:hypothetical protein CFP56_70586 [Quercus suber]
MSDPVTPSQPGFRLSPKEQLPRNVSTRNGPRGKVCAKLVVFTDRFWRRDRASFHLPEMVQHLALSMDAQRFSKCGGLFYQDRADPSSATVSHIKQSCVYVLAAVLSQHVVP